MGVLRQNLDLLDTFQADLMFVPTLEYQLSATAYVAVVQR